MPPQGKAIVKHEPMIFNSIDDMPEIVISLASTAFNKTGSWRYLRPVYEEKAAPCHKACPACNRIAEMLERVREGQIQKAWEIFRDTTPFPYVCGEVCPHPCEASCNRGKFDQSVSIMAIEQFLGEEAIKNGWQPRKIAEEKDEKVAVVGSGPAGLSCAYQLARRGYRITVYEAAAKPGGLLRWGIPEYRLPKDMLDTEISQIQKLGVHIKTDSPVKDLMALFNQGYKAVFLATGAGMSRRMDIPGEEAEGVSHALDFLKGVNSGRINKSGNRVLIVGGGNAAIDAARVSLRLGAKDVKVIYRRSRSEMPAIKSEVDAAEKEGIEICFLAAPQKLITVKTGVKGLKCIRMKLGEPGADVRLNPVPVEGSEFEIAADHVIMAIGQAVDRSMLPESIQYTGGGTIAVNPDNLQTNIKGVFAGGDAAMGPATVSDAIGSGRRAALSIENYLKDSETEEKKSVPAVKFEELNLDYFDHRIRADRILNASSAMEEAERCFSCGTCRHCDNCLIYCPDIAVTRSNGRYSINYDYCKGCGICCKECPDNYISMVEEGR